MRCPVFMPDALYLKFKADTDGTGELFAEVESGGFCGVGSAWFGNEQLIVFARELANPRLLSSHAPIKIEGGFWNDTCNEIEQLHLGLQFYPIGGFGYVGVRVSLSSPIHEYDRAESRSSISVELHTDRERLCEFARSLEMLVNGRVDNAVLDTVWGVIHPPKWMGRQISSARRS